MIKFQACWPTGQLMEIESYSYSGQDPHSNPLCNTTKLWCADIDLAQTGSWLAWQVSSLTADGKVSAAPLARTADTSNESLLYHWGHLEPPRHLSGGRRAARSHMEAFRSRWRLSNYLPHCWYIDEDWQSKESWFKQEGASRPRRTERWTCSVLTLILLHRVVCMLMFTATVEQQVDPSSIV